MLLPDPVLALTAAFTIAVSIVASRQDARIRASDSWAVRCAGGEEVARRVAREHGFQYVGRVMPSVYLLRQIPRRGLVKRFAGSPYRSIKPFAADRRVIWAEQQRARVRVKRSIYNDPMWPKMWYINDQYRLDKKPSMNILAVWNQGVTGRGVVATVLDDGIDAKHPDLVMNYDPRASYDVNGLDSDPTFRETTSNRNRHGTRCAGQIAASGNNSLCIPGVAFGARIGAIRMLDGEVTDAVEATALAYNSQHVDVYSASWGPSDNGRTVEGPGVLVKKALKDGVDKGRGGLGSIFVWASGNGGNTGDNCNVDGYANSIYTLTVGSVSEFGRVPWYSETCPCALAVTYSSGDSRSERAVATTDLHGRCTETHTGTSASAPIAAGIVALALSVNRKLSWRDVQHLTVYSANPSPFLKSVDWRVNGAGLNVSHSFGFGLIDAERMAALARNWTSAPRQRVCRLQADLPAGGLHLAENSEVSIELKAACGGVRFMEQAQAVVSLTASRRGEVQLWLRSAMGTVSQLLTRRVNDQQPGTGFTEWPFMTVHNWGELANGTWSLIIRCDASTVRVTSWHLILYGTETLPWKIAETHRLSRFQPRYNPWAELNTNGKSVERATANPSCERLNSFIISLCFLSNLLLQSPQAISIVSQ